MKVIKGLDEDTKKDIKQMTWQRLELVIAQLSHLSPLAKQLEDMGYVVPDRSQYLFQLRKELVSKKHELETYIKSKDVHEDEVHFYLRVMEKEELEEDEEEHTLQ